MIDDILNEMRYFKSHYKEFKNVDIHLQYNGEQISRIIDYIDNLEKNQRYYKNGVFSLEYDKDTMSDIIDDYKSRNEKAIEYIIENDDFYYGDELYDGYQEIINILKGDNK